MKPFRGRKIISIYPETIEKMVKIAQQVLKEDKKMEIYGGYFAVTSPEGMRIITPLVMKVKDRDEAIDRIQKEFETLFPKDQGWCSHFHDIMMLREES